MVQYKAIVKRNSPTSLVAMTITYNFFVCQAQIFFQHNDDKNIPLIYLKTSLIMLQMSITDEKNLAENRKQTK